MTHREKQSTTPHYRPTDKFGIGHRRARRGDASNGATAVAGIAAGLTGITIAIVANAWAGTY